MNTEYKIGLMGLIATVVLGLSSMAFAGESGWHDLNHHIQHTVMFDEDDDEDEEFEDEEFEDDDDEIDNEEEVDVADSRQTSGMHSNHSMTMMDAPSIHQPESATHTAVASGNWSNPSTWQNGSVPAVGATVAIPQNIVVTVGTKLTPKLKSIAIDGTLSFTTNVDTELWVDTITSSKTGKLEIGTQANPVQPDVTARIVFVDNGLIDRNADPKQVGRGAVLSGPVEIVGAQKTHRSTVATFPKAGDSQLVLSNAPIGWQVCDQLIITGSQGKTSDEARTITAINGATITLNQPLTLDHVPPKTDLNLWVANSSRNVIFESENREVLHRGHIMFMHNLDVQIHNARFYGLGRTDKTTELDDFEYEFLDTVANDGPSPIDFTIIPGPANNIRGRYAIHFHRGGTAPSTTPAVVKGSVVEDSPGWGFVNHSSNVDMIDNVSYNIQGAGFYTEAGDEVGSMVGNIAIRTVNSTFVLDDEGAIDPDLGLERGDFGNDGDGFWLSGTRVSVIDNVAAGASAHGIIFWVDGLIEPDTGRATVKVSEIENGHLITNRDTIPVWWAPMAEVRNNESYGATVGFRSRYIHSDFYMGEADSDFHAKPPQAYVNTLTPVFDGITVWGSRDGILLNYNERLSVKNARAIGIGHRFDHNKGQTAAVGVGLDLNNEATLGPGYVENITVEGYEMGFIAPRQNHWQVNNLNLKNTTDILIHEPIVEARTMPLTNVEFGDLSGTAVSGQAGQRRNIVLDVELDYAFSDPYLMLAQDRITLDGREIFFNQQQPNYVPYEEGFEVEFGDAQLDSNYIGKTNQQLWDRYGQAVAGELLPEDAISDSRIIGGKLDRNVSVQPNSTATPAPQPTQTQLQSRLIIYSYY